MRKVIKAVEILIFIGVVCAGILLLPVVHRGVKMYREAMSEKSIEQVVDSVREKEDYVKLSEISDDFQKKVIHSEDRRFYYHGGLDMIATARALYHDLKAGAYIEGGSTITQQLAKNLFYSGEKKCERKVAEVLTAFQLEHRYTKAEILELYCNVAYFGEGCYGIGQASSHYYGISAQEISGTRADSLVFTLKCPNQYNPNVYHSLVAA